MPAAQGLPKGQIAGELVISIRTMATRAQQFMDKLGFTTRAQIASWSAARLSRPRR